MQDELFSFKKAFDRLKTATGADTDSALANRLGVGQGSISSAKGKGQIPPSWLLRAASDYSVSLDWLYYGVGPMKRDGTRELVGDTRATACPRCEKLEGELVKERDLNRELVAENRQLWEKNGDLRVEVERLKARAAPDDAASEDDRNCA
jgi:hypothetical protein